MTGQRYAKVVNDLSLYIADRSQGDKPAADQVGSLAPHECQARMVRVMNADGLDSTSYYPHSGSAWKAAKAIQQSPYNQYWQPVITSRTAVNSTSIPDGSLCFWSPPTGGVFGHVAVLRRINDRVFLVGNTSGNAALEVTNTRGSLQYISLAFLPK